MSNTLYALQADADALAAQTAAERSAAGSLELVQAQYKSRRRELSAGADRGAELPERRHRARQGASAALCRHRGAVSSTGRRLVEPHRRCRQFDRLTLRIAASIMQPVLAEDGKPVTLKAMIKPLVIMLIIVAVVLGGVFGWQAFIGSMTKKYMAGAATAPQTVSTATAVATTWQSQIQAVGTLRAVRGADLSPQASGVVGEIEFDSGNEVPAGKLLLRLKPNDDFAKLQQLQAAAELAEQNLQA